MSKARKIESSGKSAFKYERAIIYCRVSSDRQKNEGHGLDSQEQRCREFAKQRGYSVSDVFRDSYTGGGDFMKRPAMSALFSLVDDNPHYNYVVLIDDLSRFARDVSAHFKLKKELLDKNVGLECTNFNFEDTPEGELIETMMAAQHQYHRKNNRRQVIQKQKARLEAGYWAFGTKRGYKMLKDPMHGKLLTPLEPDSSLLKEALEGFASGRFLHKVDVCNFLVAKGFWNKQKPERYIDKLSLIMTDPLYAGDIYYPQWEVERRSGHHEGIISRETFELIQRRLRQSSGHKRVRVDVSADFPLRGLVDCAHCGHTMTGAWSKGRGKKYAYYFCQDAECEMKRKSISKETIEVEFNKILKDVKVSETATQLVAGIFDKVWQVELSVLEGEEAENNKSQEELEQKISDLSELIIKTKNEDVRQAYEREVEKVVETLKKLEGRNKLSELDMDVPYRTALGKATQMLKSPYSVWSSVEVVEQQKLFYFIFDKNLEYSKKAGYRTDNLPCAVRLFEDFVTSNTQDVEMGGVEPPSELGCSCDSTVRRSR